MYLCVNSQNVSAFFRPFCLYNLYKNKLNCYFIFITDPYSHGLRLTSVEGGNEQNMIARLQNVFGFTLREFDRTKKSRKYFQRQEWGDFELHLPSNPNLCRWSWLECQAARCSPAGIGLGHRWEGCPEAIGAFPPGALKLDECINYLYYDM